MKGRLPGFRYDAKTGTARFEAILPSSRSKVRRRKTVMAASRDEALSLWKKFREGVLAGRTEPETFAAYLDRNWKLMATRLSSDTRAKDESRIRRVLRPFFGEVRLDRINLSLVRDFVASLKRDGYAARRPDGKTERRPYSPAAINDALSVLRKILRDAVDREELAAYPIRGRLPREKEPILRLELSPEEKARFLGAFDDEGAFRRFLAEQRDESKVVRIADRQTRGAPVTSLHGAGRRPDGKAVGYHFQRFRQSKPFFVVALETGLRKGDLLALSWSSVDLKNGWIRLTMQKTKAEATVPLSASCRAALQECRARNVGSERVFLNDTGDAPLPEVTVKRYFDTAKALAGITRRFRFHDCRHTFASQLASHGVGPHVIARALGHTSTRMTDRYARPSEEAMRSIVSALEPEETNSPANSVPQVSAVADGTSGSRINGLPGGARTHDPRLRRPMLLSS
jgi:integrase